MPCAWTISFAPTPEVYSVVIIGPRAVPPIGLGRSSTTNRSPVSTAARIAVYMVQM
jgi:hypothetical protein